MKKLKMVLMALLCVAGLHAYGDKSSQKSDCGQMAADVQQFATQLSAHNKTVFCGQFNDEQRASVMQMAGKVDQKGNMMSADGAVQHVAAQAASGSAPKTSSAGCPVK